MSTRKPTEQDKIAAHQYKDMRKQNAISLKLMAKMTGYTFAYLNHVECGFAEPGASIKEEYTRVIDYINQGCQKNKRKRKKSS